MERVSETAQNNQTRQLVFRSPSKGLLKENEVAEEILAYIQAEPACRYSLVVGSDSEVGLEVDFVTAVVVHRVGRGGRYFWTHSRSPRFATLRDRIWQEALFSINCAQRLVELFGSEQPPPNIEIHVDVGPNGPTKQMIQEVIGVVRGNGFVARIKPEAYAAAAVADRHVER
ncbi:hypothetical protein EPN90_04410 [Patescibacteria group bacterium]|nr:MAG: hypothetical protein EPN90_04410 [Patescibacteria group bacterium]